VISSKVFRLLALCSLALAAPARAGVFQYSTPVDIELIGGPGGVTFDMPQYSGPGTIIGVNIAASGSAVAGLDYPYGLSEGITVPPADHAWGLAVAGPPGLNGIFNIDTVAHYAGGSVAPCTDPNCEGGIGDLVVTSDPTAFSGNANVTDLSDFAGHGTNEFEFVAGDWGGNFSYSFIGSATVTETITIAAPEPSTWTMALIGFAAVGFAVHWRRGRKPAGQFMLRPALRFAWGRRVAHNRAS